MMLKSTVGLFLVLTALVLVVGVAVDAILPSKAKPASGPFGSLATVSIPEKTLPVPEALRLAAASPEPKADPVAPVPVAAVAPAAPAPVPPVPVSTVPAARVVNLYRSDSSAPDQQTLATAPVPVAVPAPPAPQPVRTQIATAVDPAPASVSAASDEAAAPTPPARQPADTSAKVRPGGTVDINRAPLSVLNHLPGMGLIGRTIVNHRPYRSIQDLVDRRVLRSRDFERLRSRIAVE